MYTQNNTNETTNTHRCALCWNDHGATYRAPNYRDGITVCATHANALESGSWEHGRTYAVEPLTAEQEYEFVFVYGTLQDDSGYEATLTGWRKDTSGRYPTIIPNPDGEVEGEVQKVTAQRLLQLDQYEGVPTLYKRLSAPMGVYVYIGDPAKLGAEGRLNFQKSYLQDCMQDATLTVSADFQPSALPIQEQQ